MTISSPRSVRFREDGGERLVKSDQDDSETGEPLYSDEEIRSSNYYKFTVEQLKGLLREKGLKKSGLKGELVQRLMRGDEEERSSGQQRKGSLKSSLLSSSLSSSSSSSSVPLPASSFAGSVQARKVEESQANGSASLAFLNCRDDDGSIERAEENLLHVPANLSLVASPLVTLYLFVQFVKVELRRIWRYGFRGILATLALVCLFVALLASKAIDGPHVEYVARFEAEFFWYLKWVVLGVLSSIGLGSGAHTFLLFLGPMIAETTTAAYACDSLSFALFGANSFTCPDSFSRLDKGPAVTLWSIFRKVQWPAFAWGAGTAIGELPPYFVARASARAKMSVPKSSGGPKGKDQLMHDAQVLLDQSSPSHLETLSSGVRYIVEKFGFVGILLCASIPNPLFDLAGITCGYYMVPFYKFFLATFIGKACVKATLQSAFVITLFSKTNMEFVLSKLHTAFPDMIAHIESYLETQRKAFLQKGSAAAEEGFNLVAALWNSFLALMLLYFVLSIVQSFARSYATVLLEARVEELRAKQRKRKSSQ